MKEKGMNTVFVGIGLVLLGGILISTAIIAGVMISHDHPVVESDPNKTITVIIEEVAPRGSVPTYVEEEIFGYHFHTYIFDINPDHTEEALAFRRRSRQLILDGVFPECSLGVIFRGWIGPHPFSQYEMCCNKTSFPAANSFVMQNRGNLSVLIHPLTIYDREDHGNRAWWYGHPVPLDLECPCLDDWRPEPRACTVYPDFPDELPNVDATFDNQFTSHDWSDLLPGTELDDYVKCRLRTSGLVQTS